MGMAWMFIKLNFILLWPLSFIKIPAIPHIYIYIYIILYNKVSDQKAIQIYLIINSKWVSTASEIVLNFWNTYFIFTCNKN